MLSKVGVHPCAPLPARERSAGTDEHEQEKNVERDKIHRPAEKAGWKGGWLWGGQGIRYSLPPFQMCLSHPLDSTWSPGLLKCFTFQDFLPYLPGSVSWCRFLPSQGLTSERRHPTPSIRQQLPSRTLDKRGF